MIASAKKVPIREIEGPFEKGKEEFSPGFVKSKRAGPLSRVNIWGNVVRTFSSDKGFRSITLDDLTGTIDVNVFDDNKGLLEGIREGNVVRVIGKTREYNGRVYVLCEGIQRIDFSEEMLQRLENVVSLRELLKKKFSGESAKSKKASGQELKEDGFVRASEIDVEKKVIE